MSVNLPQLLVGVNAGRNSTHAIIVREEADGKLRLMGDHREREVIHNPDETSLIGHVRECIEKAIANAHVSSEDILAIGIAAPGQVDIASGDLLFSPLFDLKDYPFPFIARLRRYFPTHSLTLLSNDDAYGIGEQSIGEGKGVKDLIYIRVGYNIGAGIIIGGELYTGADGLAGQFGHMVVDLNGPVCSCGNRGCLDALVSRAAIARKLLGAHKGGQRTVLADKLKQELVDINSAVLHEAIDEEDALSCQVVEEAAAILGIGIANIINFLNPDRVVLGGDVIDEVDLFFETAVEVARKSSLHATKRNVSIVRGRLGTTAGAYGAAVFARQRAIKEKTE